MKRKAYPSGYEYQMSQLAPQTMANYRAQLKRLRRILPLMPEDHPEREKVVRRIEKLTNQLGKEMTDLESWLAKRPGRVRNSPGDLKELEKQLVDATPEEAKVEIAKAEDKLAELKARVQESHPNLIDEIERRKAERESERQLHDMMTNANNNIGGESDTEEHDKTTNEVSRAAKAE